MRSSSSLSLCGHHRPSFGLLPSCRSTFGKLIWNMIFGIMKIIWDVNLLLAHRKLSISPCLDTGWVIWTELVITGSNVCDVHQWIAHAWSTNYGARFGPCYLIWIVHFFPLIKYFSKNPDWSKINSLCFQNAFVLKKRKRKKKEIPSWISTWTLPNQHDENTEMFRTLIEEQDLGWACNGCTCVFTLCTHE